MHLHTLALAHACTHSVMTFLGVKKGDPGGKNDMMTFLGVKKGDPGGKNDIAWDAS